MLRTARWTGAAYLGIVACGLFAELFVRGSLVVPGDAVATAHRIAEAPGLFGLGLGADVLMIGLDVAVAFGLYRLLRPVSRPLALAATLFRLTPWRSTPGADASRRSRRGRAEQAASPLGVS
jgi:hypothetical protein